MNTNDFTLGYARARRDLGCRYTLGFYDKKPEEDRRHTLGVTPVRPDLRILHAARYTIPSKASKRNARLAAALLVPGMFEGGGLRAHVFPVRPVSRRSWEVLIGVDFPVLVPRSGTGDTTREIWAVLKAAQRVVHQFDRRMTIAAKGEADGEAATRAVFLEPAEVPPGRYTLTVVVRDATGESPWTDSHEVEIPDVPVGEPLIVAPILGKRRGGDIVVVGSQGPRGRSGSPSNDRVAAASSFRPVFVQEVDKTEPAAVLTQACLLGRSRRTADPLWIVRIVTQQDGSAAGELPEGSLAAPEEGRKIACEAFVDVIPADRLRIGRYAYEAAIRNGEGAVASTASLPFEIVVEDPR